MIVFTISVAPQTTMATIGISQIPRSVIDRMSSSSSWVVRRSPLVVGKSGNLPLANDDRLTTNDSFSGGADRDRTGGLLVANQALSQLSYSPSSVVRLWSFVVRKKPTTNDARPTADSGGPG